jgi:hypothetical protein
MTVPFARVMTTLDQEPPYRMSLLCAVFQKAGSWSAESVWLFVATGMVIQKLGNE